MENAKDVKAVSSELTRIDGRPVRITTWRNFTDATTSTAINSAVDSHLVDYVDSWAYLAVQLLLESPYGFRTPDGEVGVVRFRKHVLQDGYDVEMDDGYEVVIFEGSQHVMTVAEESIESAVKTHWADKYLSS